MPMLFMGEEWGASTPWQFFTDHTDPELAAAVRPAGGGSSPRTAGRRATCPTRRTRATRGVRCWTGPSSTRGAAAALLAWHRDLLALRSRLPELRNDRLDSVGISFDPGGDWLVVARGSLRVVVNLAAAGAVVPVDEVPEYLVMAFGAGGSWSPAVSGCRVTALRSSRSENYQRPPNSGAIQQNLAFEPVDRW